MKNILLFISILLGCSTYTDAICQKPVAFKKGKLIFKDRFHGALDTANWLVETIPLPNNKVYTVNNRLWLDTQDGVTVWYPQPLKGNYCIEYKRHVVMDSGINDRLSDLNNFWQASDPNSQNLFTRDGVFESYDDLQLYYAGIGGNYNTTSRFRKYSGSQGKPVLVEYLDPAHLLKPNHTYTIRILYVNGTTQLFVDHTLWFTYEDPDPLPAGYFGIRSTKSRQWVSNMRIWEVR